MMSDTLAYPVALPTEGRGRSFGSILSNFLPLALFMAAFPFAVQSDMGMRAILAASIFLLLYILRGSAACIIFAFVYCCLMGGIRRWLMPVLGYPGQDVFLMISPIFAILYCLTLAFTRRLPMDTPLSKMVLALIVVMSAQIFNPIQGPLVVGLAGAMFYIVPLLWFYIARRFGTVELARKWLWLLIGIGIAASLHGLYQGFVGFTASETQWGQMSDNIASNVGGVMRPLSTFTHSGEYVFFLCKALMLLWAFWLWRRNFLLLLPIPLLAVAAFLVGSRGAVVVTLACLVALYAVQGRTLRSWIPRGGLALIIGVFGMYYSLRQVQEQTHPQSTQAVIDHQVSGLLNPLDTNKSTVGIHGQMLMVGFSSAFSNPLGRGLGITTMAASKYGGMSESTEMDITNMFVSLGLIGGILYLAIVVHVFIMALRYWHRTRSIEALGILGILLISPGFWMNGGLYAHAMYIWVCIGILDQLQLDLQKRDTAARLAKETPNEISAGYA